MEKKRRRCIPGYIILGIIVLLAVILEVGSWWAEASYHAGITEILYTLTLPLTGTNNSAIQEILVNTLPPIIKRLAIFIVLGFICFDCKLTDKLFSWFKKFDIRRVLRYLMILLVLGYGIYAYNYADNLIGLTSYIKYKTTKTTIYEDIWVDPEKINIKAPENKKNVIVLYLESMETTYMDKENGGIEEINYIPNLTNLCKENISFSNRNNLPGGFISGAGSNFTMGALFSSTAGIPFAFPINGNFVSNFNAVGGELGKGVYNIGEILKKNGYHNYFMCGSDKAHGGRGPYLEAHGDYQIYDYNTALENKDIPQGYKVWWGFEDSKLFEFAKKELIDLASKDEPFNFTFLTVDTHHEGGYHCQLCKDEYTPDLANVLKCADNQVENFVEWFKKQPFYENTVLVILGDHPRMDGILIDKDMLNDLDKRPVYNCFINVDKEFDASREKSRVATTMDMLPTILSAMNFEIEGNRIGLGTDLFSDQDTYAEELGVDYFYTEINKASDFYINKFDKGIDN